MDKRDKSDAAERYADIQPGEHLGCIYESEAEFRAVIIPYIRAGLERGEKVVYVADLRPAETVLSLLSDQGLAMEACLARGQLVIAASGDTYLRGGVFDPDAMLDYLTQVVAQALADGYPSVRITGEMTWALRGLPGSERVIEYEARLNNFFPGSKCSAICQYHRQFFDPTILLDVLHTHPKIIIGDQLHENFYYIPPDIFLDDRPSARLQQWVQSLQSAKQAQEALHRSESFLRQTQDITQVGGWEYDVTAARLSWTDEVYRIYEVARDYDINDIDRVVAFYAPRDRAAIAAAFRRALEQGESYDLELKFIGAGGAEKWVRTRGEVEMRGGKAARVYGSIMDVTTAHRAQEIERAQRAFAEALRETAAALNSTLDLDAVLDRVLDNVERVMPSTSDAALILFLDPRAETVRVVRARGLRGFSPPPGLSRWSGPVSPLFGVSDVLTAGALLRLDDVAGQPPWNASPLTAWIGSVLSAPVVIRGGVAGLLTLAGARPRAFNGLDADHLSAFAGQAAIAIENAQLYAEVRALAINDELTEVLNRRGLFQVGEREIERARRFGHPLAALMIDIDHFKRVNDTYGHFIGDRVLRILAGCSRAQVRHVDVVARYGGEEFVILLPEIDREGALVVAERLRQAIERLEVNAGVDEHDSGTMVRLTVSIGVAALAPGHDLTALLNLVDQTLYAAKQAGRNCVILGN